MELWRGHAALRAELGELLPLLAKRADSLPRAAVLGPEVPLVLHGRYLDVELSAAFHAITQKDGKYRNFYTGVEAVCGGVYDLLLVTLQKGDVEKEHLRYRDYPIHETLFHWQSQAGTRQEDRSGRRHLRPAEEKVQPLLFVREAKKDERGVTGAFRYLGPVAPQSARGERPISIEWGLTAPLQPEWVRRWSNAG